MDKTTIVVSQSAPESADARNAAGKNAQQNLALGEKLAAALASAGVDVLLIPHLYSLHKSHPAVHRLKEIDGRMLLVSQLYPRAAYWTASWLGIRGEADGAESKDSGPHDGEGEVSALNLDEYENFDELVAECMRRAGSAGRKKAAKGRIERISDDLAPRWYPVLDYSRCTGCGQCREFCLFGVYSLEDGRICVASPDNCKHGCPACARVCPRGAIMFPHYAGSPEIAGAAGTEKLFSAECKCAGGDGLDALIDALDELDE